MNKPVKRRASDKRERLDLLERKVDLLQEAVGQLLQLAQADPYALSFRQFQARADAQTRGA